MRIGIDATICFTRKPTGLGVYTISIINELCKIHDDVVIWTVDDTGMAVEKEKIRMVLQALRFTGSKVFQIRPLWIDMFLPRLLKQEGIDVLFSTVPSALSRSPIPHVVTVLDLIPLTFPGETPISVYWNYKYRVPAILKSATALVAISEYTKKDVEKHFSIDPNNIHTVYLGYDAVNFSPKNNFRILERYGLQPKGYLLYVGNASPRKNLSNLINAYSCIQDRLPHKLVLCGSKTSKESRQLQKLISRYGLDRRVVLIDYVPYTDLPVLYSGAALFVYVSLYEGFGLPILEAMACGAPVIASTTTSIPEVAGNAAFLVDPTDDQAIADAIVQIIGDPQRMIELSEAGKERSNQFSWERTAQGILAVLQSSVR